MSRHRYYGNIKNNIDDYDDSALGHSFDDKSSGLSHYFNKGNKKYNDDDEEEEEAYYGEERRNNRFDDGDDDGQEENDRELLDDCVNEVFAVLGDDDKITEEDVVDAVRICNYDANAAVQYLLETPTKKSKSKLVNNATKKPQQQSQQAQQPKTGTLPAKQSAMAKTIASVPSVGVNNSSNLNVKKQPVTNNNNNNNNVKNNKKIIAGSNNVDENEDEEIEAFKFNTPSPDDVARSLQNLAFKRDEKQDNNNNNNKTITPVTTKKVAPPPGFSPKPSPQLPNSAALTPSASSGSLKNLVNKNDENNVDDKQKPKIKKKKNRNNDKNGEIIGEDENGKESEKKVITELVPMRSAKSTIELMKVVTENSKKEKPHLNMVVCGHVDAGKSTLMGHCLNLLGNVDDKSMHKYKTESQKSGKGSFAFAWVLDGHGDERERGITVDVAITHFETPDRSITLLDAPGHRDYVPNMISGAAQADVALLVVDCSPGSFERGFDADGQTKEHAVLIRSLGVSQVIVVCNKMDMINWNEERYLEVSKKMTAFLKQTGFKDNAVRSVPCSGLSGLNLISKIGKQSCAWYNDGATLVDLINSFNPAERLIDKPLRLCVNEVYKTIYLGCTVGGKIETGIIAIGDKVWIMPAHILATVKGIQKRDENVKYAIAGDNVEIGLNDVDIDTLSIGNIICDPIQSVKIHQKFEAQILTFQNLVMPILKGSQLVLHSQSMTEVITVTKLVNIIQTGVIGHESSNNNNNNNNSSSSSSSSSSNSSAPRALGKNVNAIIEFKAERRICLELYQNFKQLGRFTLRHQDTSVAAGVITKIIK